MSLTSENMTPADFAAISRNDGGFGGGGNAWWIIILFLFAFCGGWGGFGNGRGSAGGAADNYVLASDFAQVERKLDSVNNGLCDGFYAQAQLVNGVNQNLSNGFANAELSRANQQAALVNNLFGIQSGIQNCCCETREAIAGVNYNLASQSCETRTALNTAARDIIDSQTNGTRAILEAITAQRMEAKDEKIAELNAKVQQLNLAASQAAQNNYLINQLRPAPVPAFNVGAPYQFGGCGCTCGA